MKSKLPSFLTLIMVASFFLGSVVQPSLVAPPMADEQNQLATATGKSQEVVPGETPEGLTTPEWDSIQQAVREAGYHFAYHEATDEIPDPYYWAPNHSQGWETIFTPRGIQVSPRDSDAWSWGLTLTGYGYLDNGDLEGFQNLPGLRAEKNTLTYQWDGNISEWWINKAGGLEQGFTLQERPVTNGQSPLVIEMAVTGTLQPVQMGDAVHFQNENGATVLTYDKLHVTDANSKPVPARFLAKEDTLLILIEDESVLYPLMIDPWVQTAKLTASDGAGGDRFGYSVDVSGNTVVIGVYYDDDAGSGSGSAYVYVRPETGWVTGTEIAKLTASDAVAWDRFGISVAISGNTVVVGAYGDNNYRGSVYVYVKPVTGWITGTETAKLTASDAAASDFFGYSVAISGDTVVSGAYGDDDAGDNSGAAYVYVRPGTGWETTNQETAKLTSSDGTESDNLGVSVGVSQDTIVVGAYNDDHAGISSGSAYVYVRPEIGWVTTVETAKLTAGDGAAGDHYGHSVAVSCDTVVIGASHKDDIGGSDSGAAYVYVRPVTGWVTTDSEAAKLTASDAAPADIFGMSVAVSGNTVVVGADWDDNGSGSAYVYVQPEAGWVTITETEKLIASDRAEGDNFGRSVAVSGDTLVIGAWGDSGDSGSAYMFQNSYCTRQSGHWNLTSTWVGGEVPSSNDDACISTGDTVTLDENAAANRVVVNPRAALDLAIFNLTVEDTMTNHGTITQTQTVESANIEFLHIQNIAGDNTKYRGVDIDATAYNQNLGTVRIGLRETIDWFGWYNEGGVDVTQFCTNAGEGLLSYAERCYTIAPEFEPTTDVTVRLWGSTGELSGISESNLAVHRHLGLGLGWTELSNRVVGSDGEYSYAQGTTNGFSAFLLGQTGNAPTPIQLQDFSASSAGEANQGTVFLSAAILALSGFFIWKRRRAS